jgi:hypothetical protein
LFPEKSASEFNYFLDCGLEYVRFQLKP